MIKSIFGTGGITIHSGHQTLPYVSPSSQSYELDNRVCYNGDLRFVNGSYQIFSNGNWQTANSTPDPIIDLSPEIKNILEWAKKRMVFDQQVETLAEQYPAVKTAKDHLDMVMALVKDY